MAPFQRTGTAAGSLFGALAALLLAACSRAPAPAAPVAAADAAAPRYLYVVHCDAHVDKLDLATRTVAESFSLGPRSGSPPAVPAAADGTMDGCLTQRVLADSTGDAVSLIAPKQARLDADGLQEFQALRFALPGWTLLSAQPAGRWPEAPRLEADAQGRARLADDSQWTPVTVWDLSRYAGQPADARGLVLATSGQKALLSVLSAQSKELALGLADATALTVTPLPALPVTNLAHAHLAPGGSHVLIETTDSSAPDAPATGALALYDSSGRRVLDQPDAGIRGMRFVAMTPEGSAVYQAGSEYRFVVLGVRFGSAAVGKPLPALAEPGLVYSAK